MKIWLELFLSCQQGGRSAHGRIARPTYENMWEVNVNGFTPKKRPAPTFCQMAGPHRMVVTDDAIKFFELGSDSPKTFDMKEIIAHGKVNRYYHIHTGPITIYGQGEIRVDCKNKDVADQIYSTVSITKIFKNTIKSAIPFS